MSYLIVSFDPGVVNFGVACLICDIHGNISLEYSETFNVKGRRSHEPSLMMEMMTKVGGEVTRIETSINTDNPTIWVLEYQPPLATRSNPGLVRMNTWVEAFIETWLMLKEKPYRVIASSTVKKHFNFPVAARDTQYSSNKKHTILIATGIVGSRGLNDHIADCVLNGAYVSSTITGNRI